MHDRSRPGYECAKLSSSGTGVSRAERAEPVNLFEMLPILATLTRSENTPRNE